MRTRAKRHGARRAPGLSASARAMWTRLYARAPLLDLPSGFREPFPPLGRVVKSGWLTPPGPLLDVGCGIGSNALWLARQGFRVTGTDIAPGAVQAAEKSRGKVPKNPTFVVDDILASNLPAGKYAGAVDVGCFHTLPPRTRRVYSTNLARLLRAGAPHVLFWVAPEETGSWGPPHRLSVAEVTDSFEPWFRIDRLEYRPRVVRLTERVRRSSRPLTTLAGFSARFVRRERPSPSRG